MSDWSMDQSACCYVTSNAQSRASAVQVVEAVRREKLNKEVEAGIMGAGLLLLTGVGIFMVVRDAIHLVGG